MQAPSLDRLVQGQASEIESEVNIVMRQREKIVNNLHDITGRDTALLNEDLNRDFYLTAYEAREYGLIDRVLQPKGLDVKPIYENNLFAPSPSF